MERPPRSLTIPAWELPGVRARLRAPQPWAGLATRVGADWAAVVFLWFAAPPALVLAGLLHAGTWPLGFWLAACGSFFTGLVLALRLEPLPPRRVLAPSDLPEAGPAPEARGHGGIEMRAMFSDAELSVLDLPGIAPGMSPAEVLEHLAKLREQGDLSGNEYLRALERLGVAG
jgi:hypothetical protein